MLARGDWWRRTWTWKVLGDLARMSVVCPLAVVYVHLVLVPVLVLVLGGACAFHGTTARGEGDTAGLGRTGRRADSAPNARLVLGRTRAHFAEARILWLTLHLTLAPSEPLPSVDSTRGQWMPSTEPCFAT
jgi:hypothetical protein